MNNPLKTLSRLSFISFCLILSTHLLGHFKEGFYMGGEIGWNGMNQKSDSNYILDSGSIPSQDPFTYDDDYDGPNLGLFAGYVTCPCGEDHFLRIIPEVFLQAGRVRHTTDFVVDQDHHYKDKVSMPWSFGGKVKIGVVFGFHENCNPHSFLKHIIGNQRQWMAYGLVGASINPIEWQRQGEGFPLAEQKKKAIGLILGVGIEREMNNQHRIGLEVLHTRYKKQNFSSADVDEVSFHTYTAKINMISLNIRYTIPF